jgi:chitinase
MSNNLTGTDSNDDMFGAGFADILHGGDGDDQIFGDQGNDTLFGDDGDDKLFGGADQDTFVDIRGNNTIDGGTGFDTVDYSDFFGGRVTVTLAESGLQGMAIRNDLIRVVGGPGYLLEDGRDTLVSIENVVGTVDNDTIVGNSDANVLRGGAGADKVTGGGGADKFVFLEGDISSSGNDKITDFEAFDRIDLLGIDAQTDVAGNNAFHFVDEFTGHSGELMIHRFQGEATILGDTDGNGSYDLMIQVHEVTAGALSHNDFIL